MKTSIQLAALALVSSLSSSAWAENPCMEALSADDAADLIEGGTLRDVDAGDPLRAEVVALVRAPVDELAAIVSDYDRATEWAPATGACAINGRDGDAVLVDGTTVLPWPLTDRTWRMRSQFGYRDVDGRNAWVLAWDYVEGSGNIDDSFGYWLLTPYDPDPSYTYVKYVVNADPGIPVPDFLFAWVTRSALPDLIDSLRERHDDLY